MPVNAVKGIYDTSKFYLLEAVNLGDEYDNDDLSDLPIEFDKSVLIL